MSDYVEILLGCFGRTAMINRLAAMLTAVMGGLAGLLAGNNSVAAADAASPRATQRAVVVENEVCRYKIGTDGKNPALVNLADCR